ncbi:MAG: saccharopine dehydrogenase C-terminal domain-containing protein [Chitinophagaceae bacterium]
MHIAVLGAGMVGRAIAIDLAKDFDVTSFDLSPVSLEILQKKCAAIRTAQTDLGDFNNYPSLLAPFDYVVNAVPGFMGYAALEAIILSKKNVVDISFFAEDALQLDALAKANGVTAITDCGVAPGLSNLLLGHYNEIMQVQSFECLVGGLPKQRVLPFEYKAPFSPIDVLEEYTRPARYQENGHIVTRPALSEPELIDFEKPGTLESFNTDGLRSLLFTMSHIPDMKEKTLRYPGHISLIQALLKAGFLDTNPIEYKGQTIVPRAFTSAVLFNQWQLGPTEPEFTLMRVTINDSKKSIGCLLYDEYDAATEISSMSRTTGYTCTGAVRLLVNNYFTEKGVFPPELVGKHPACFEFMLAHLKERNISFVITEKPI